jgi:hypothetical protein
MLWAHPGHTRSQWLAEGAGLGRVGKVPQSHCVVVASSQSVSGRGKNKAQYAAAMAG